MSDWRVDVLRQLRMPVTPSNLAFLAAWGRAEGGGGLAGRDTTDYNWLNTSWEMPGSTRYNSHGVQEYPNYRTGIIATAKTLNQDYYTQIRQLLAQGTAPMSALAGAVYSSPWGTKSGIGGVSGQAAPQVAAAGGGGGAPPSISPVPAPTPFTPSATPLLPITTMSDPRQQSQALLSALLQPPARPTPQQMQPPPQQSSPATPAPSAGTPGNVRFKTTSGGPTGVREMFYDPRGAYDEGSWISPIGGHSDHVHVSFGNPQAALQIMAMAQKMGLRVGENPYYDPVDPVHTQGSYHYQNFPGKYNGRTLGRGADFSGSASLMSLLWDRILKGYLR